MPERLHAEEKWERESWIDTASERELREGLHICRANWVGLWKEAQVLAGEVEARGRDLAVLRTALERIEKAAQQPGKFTALEKIGISNLAHEALSRLTDETPGGT